MVETITPVVHGGRGRWARALALHVLGATATAALFGAAVAGLGRALGAPWDRAGLLLLAAAAALYALGELRVLAIPVPQLRRQVPDWWRTFFGYDLAAALYGAGLGVGFLTYLANGTLVVVALAAFASGSPAIGAAIVAPFGLLRGLGAVTAYASETPEASRALLDRLVAAPERRRRLVNAAALATVAVAACAGGLRPAPGGWWRLAAAAVGVTFGWAAASKVAGRRRWRRVLRAHELPARLERAAFSVVPAAEALVPALVLAGRPRAAAALALALLAGFTTETVRVRRRVGPRVPCGCFGGREDVGFRAVLARNLVLGGLATAVLLAARPVPAARPLGMPAASDLAPFALVLGSGAVAVLVGWRAAAWLARGRAA